MAGLKEIADQAPTPWGRFVRVVREGKADRVPVALIVDSPWLPGYAGIDTLDYFLRDDEWLGWGRWVRALGAWRRRQW